MLGTRNDFNLQLKLAAGGFVTLVQINPHVSPHRTLSLGSFTALQSHPGMVCKNQPWHFLEVPIIFAKWTFSSRVTDSKLTLFHKKWAGIRTKETLWKQQQQLATWFGSQEISKQCLCTHETFQESITLHETPLVDRGCSLGKTQRRQSSEQR